LYIVNEEEEGLYFHRERKIVTDIDPTKNLAKFYGNADYYNFTVEER